MKAIKTKFGVLGIEPVANKRGVFRLYDTAKRILFYNCDKKYLKQQIKRLNKCQSVGEWLQDFENVCWADNIQLVEEYVKSYQKINGRNFDKNYFIGNYNKIGNTYIFFEYSDCYK